MATVLVSIAATILAILAALWYIRGKKGLRKYITQKMKKMIDKEESKEEENSGEESSEGENNVEENNEENINAEERKIQLGGGWGTRLSRTWGKLGVRKRRNDVERAES